MQNYIQVVVRFYVVETDNSRIIRGAIESSSHLCVLADLFDVLKGIRWLKHILYVVEGGVDDFVVVGQTIELQCR